MPEVAKHDDTRAITQRFESTKTAYNYAAAAAHLGFNLTIMLRRDCHPPLDCFSDFRRIFDCGELCKSEHWTVTITASTDRLDSAHMHDHDMATLSELMAPTARSK